MSAIIIGNIDFVKKLPGILKICELVLGILCMSLSAHYMTGMKWGVIFFQSELFFLIMSCTFFIGTALIIMASLVSINTESRLRQTLFEPLYHGLAFILYFAGSVAVLADTSINFSGQRRDSFLAAGSIGIINSVFYAVSTFDSYRGYVTE